MDRTQVVIPAGEIQRQRDFTARDAALFSRLGREPRAFVDTYGCPNVRV